MMRRPSIRFSLAHACMVVAALVTFVAVTSILRERNEMRTVAIARTELAAGSTIDGQSMDAGFDVVSVRADSPLLDGVANPTAIPSGQLSRPIAAGEPLRSTDVVPVESGSAIRTITVAVDEVTLTGLGLQVGDAVDVIGAADDGTLGFVVAGVRVARLPGGTAAGGAFAVREDAFVTVEVSDAEALRIVGALRAGDVEIVRSTGAAALSPEAAGNG